MELMNRRIVYSKQDPDYCTQADAFCSCNNNRNGPVVCDCGEDIEAKTCSIEYNEFRISSSLILYKIVRDIPDRVSDIALREVSTGNRYANIALRDVSTWRHGAALKAHQFTTIGNSSQTTVYLVLPRSAQITYTLSLGPHDVYTPYVTEGNKLGNVVQSLLATPRLRTKKALPLTALSVHEWAWDEQLATATTLLSNDNREVQFHPGYSSGTAAIRGDSPFQQGHIYYWEIKMLTSLYGTDVMVGVGTKKAQLDKSAYQFCSLLGSDKESWGFSYKEFKLKTREIKYFSTLPLAVQGRPSGASQDGANLPTVFRPNTTSGAHGGIVQSRTEVDLILTDFDKDKREAIVSLPRKIAVKYTAGHDCQHQKSSTIFNNKQYTEENSV
ncbi:SPRY domain-containing SOCS box protein 3 [Homalodisca vitripennis]|nr:SPRY domain-containing SOCS box protein 3 [Homalodisca vitripennis]